MRLKDKVAIITGSSSGIGFEVAKAYLNEGAKVVVCGISDEDTNQALIKLKEILSSKQAKLEDEINQ